MQEETGPAPGVIVCSCTGRHIGIDQGCRAHHTVNTGWSGIVSICIGRHLLHGRGHLLHRTGRLFDGRRRIVGDIGDLLDGVLQSLRIAELLLGLGRGLFNLTCGTFRRLLDQLS